MKMRYFFLISFNPFFTTAKMKNLFSSHYCPVLQHTIIIKAYVHLHKLHNKISQHFVGKKKEKEQLLWKEFQLFRTNRILCVKYRSLQIPLNFYTNKMDNAGVELVYNVLFIQYLRMLTFGTLWTLATIHLIGNSCSL